MTTEDIKGTPFAAFLQDHECDHTFEGEAGLLTNRKNCKKNPQHLDFIPAPSFTKDHLPPDYRDDDIFASIKSLSDITVRVSVKHTSNRRPDLYPGTTVPYPFSQYKGRNLLRVGTGCVLGVTKKSFDSGPCPCHVCSSSSPRDTWWEIRIATAAHVVFDSEEAGHATCELWYDTDLDLSNIPRLYGMKVKVCQIDEDRCEFLTATHDLDLGTRLEEMRKLSVDRYRKVVTKYPGDPSPSRPLLVVVSHPHGCTKQVTVGLWKHRQASLKTDKEGRFIRDSQYIYTTPTCPGSSGSPTWILSRSAWVHPHPHRGSSRMKGNMSGAVWDDLDSDDDM